MLTLPRPLSLTPAQFAQACAAKPEAVLELDTDGMLIEEPPARGTLECSQPPALNLPDQLPVLLYKHAQRTTTTHSNSESQPTADGIS